MSLYPVGLVCKFQPDSLGGGDREVEKTLYEKMLILVSHAKGQRTGIDISLLTIVLFLCELSNKYVFESNVNVS